MNERKQRGSDASVVHEIRHVTYGESTQDETTPDGCWDLVFMRTQGSLLVLQTGLITKPVALAFEAGDEYLSISFKPGVFMPKRPGSEMVDLGVVHEGVSERAFFLDHDKLELPTFENAEGLVERLCRRGVLAVDEIVQGVVEGRPRAISPRSMQRHFVQTTGVTSKELAQIFRAQQAVRLLVSGQPIVQVALELGYADQAHLTRSLKRIMGRTPGELARARKR